MQLYYPVAAIANVILTCQRNDGELGLERASEMGTRLECLANDDAKCCQDQSYNKRQPAVHHALEIMGLEHAL
jgi:hypothetical protein